MSNRSTVLSLWTFRLGLHGETTGLALSLLPPLPAVVPGRNHETPSSMRPLSADRWNRVWFMLDVLSLLLLMDPADAECESGYPCTAGVTP